MPRQIGDSTSHNFTSFPVRGLGYWHVSLQWTDFDWLRLWCWLVIITKQIVPGLLCYDKKRLGPWLRKLMFLSSTNSNLKRQIWSKIRLLSRSKTFRRNQLSANCWKTLFLQFQLLDRLEIWEIVSLLSRCVLWSGHAEYEYKQYLSYPHIIVWVFVFNMNIKSISLIHGVSTPEDTPWIREILFVIILRNRWDLWVCIAIYETLPSFGMQYRLEMWGKGLNHRPNTKMVIVTWISVESSLLYCLI